MESLPTQQPLPVPVQEVVRTNCISRAPFTSGTGEEKGQASESPISGEGQGNKQGGSGDGYKEGRGDEDEEVNANVGASNQWLTITPDHLMVTVAPDSFLAYHAYILKTDKEDRLPVLLHPKVKVIGYYIRTYEAQYGNIIPAPVRGKYDDKITAQLFRLRNPKDFERFAYAAGDGWTKSVVPVALYPRMDGEKPLGYRLEVKACMMVCPPDYPGLMDKPWDHMEWYSSGEPELLTFEALEAAEHAIDESPPLSPVEEPENPRLYYKE